MCNRSGLDTISAGGTIAFAIECYENGLIRKDDTGGLELTWGNSKAVIELLKLIINREGIGDILADGSKIASEKIGKGSEKFAITSMGQELGMHDAKYYRSLGLSYAFDPTPGRHTTGSLDMAAGGSLAKGGFLEGFSLPENVSEDGEDRNKALKLIDGFAKLTSSLGLCLMAPRFGKYPFFEFIKALTGWDTTLDELIKTGLRIQTLRQVFTLREGIDIASNKLPGRVIGDPPFESGPYKDKTIDYQSEYKGYCEKMGWNPENGYPLKETLKDLDLDFVIEDLYLTKTI
jgi:aldehyde:ferredoxin oxidoreductase